MGICPNEERELNNMIDIHCHILPGIDDGARNLRDAQTMLMLQRSIGVDRMFLTPHFHPEKKTLSEFLADRENAWCVFSAEMDASVKKQIRLGAEVQYCQGLLSLDLRKLTLGDSNYLLLEFPSHYPTYAVQIMEKLMSYGLVPILAHVERYSYFREEPELLKRLINLGVLAQVSAQSLFDKKDKHFAFACLSHNLAQIIASDAHNITNRRPCMDLLHKLPEEIRNLHDAFTTAVWENAEPAYISASSVKKTFLGYR